MDLLGCGKRQCLKVLDPSRNPFSTSEDDVQDLTKAEDGLVNTPRNVENLLEPERHEYGIEVYKMDDLLKGIDSIQETLDMIARRVQ